MAATKQIFSKFAPTGQYFITKWRIEFHEIPANVLVAIVRSQADGQTKVHTRCPHKALFFFPPAQKTSNAEFHGRQ